MIIILFILKIFPMHAWLTPVLMLCERTHSWGHCHKSSASTHCCNTIYTTNFHIHILLGKYPEDNVACKLTHVLCAAILYLYKWLALIPCGEIHSWGHYCGLVHTCHMSSISKPVLQYCTPPSEVPATLTCHTLNIKTFVNCIENEVTLKKEKSLFWTSTNSTSLNSSVSTVTGYGLADQD